jgi:3-phosphoshikimate 1-carboxyvinyltransferase
MLTGTERMKQRPIGILVNALNEIGCKIDYLGQKVFPPLQIHPFSNQKTSIIKMPGNVSSQYISAMLMIAPTLPDGLTIELTGEISSRPYIDMTLSMMRKFGIEASFEKNFVKIRHQNLKPVEYTVETDWSSASYWYSVLLLGPFQEIKIRGLRKKSFQGDSRIAEFTKPLGVKTEYSDDHILISKASRSSDKIDIDFSDNPDLAQTMAVICSARRIAARFTGLQSLRIKETDRIAALQNELKKLGTKLAELNGEWRISHEGSLILNQTNFSTYEDHRMAMSFAPLSFLGPVVIDNPEVVRKSYPSFWEDLNRAGIEIQELS